MSKSRPILVFAISFWLAAVLQQAAIDRVQIGGARPDLLLTLALVTAVMFAPKYSALFGFVAGLLHGAIAGADLAHFTISYTIVAYFAGFLSWLELDIRAWYVGLVVIGGTAIAGLLMMIPGPPPLFWPHLGDTILSAIYNGVLAMPLYALMKRLLHPKVK